MINTAKLGNLLHIAQTELRILNRNCSLTRADKVKLKSFYLEYVFAPKAQRLIGRPVPAGPPAEVPALKESFVGQKLLTAKELEAWLKIDAKTLYGYAKEKLIPHLRLQSSVRFPEKEIRAWIERRHFVPASMKKNGKRPRSSK